MIPRRIALALPALALAGPFAGLARAHALVTGSTPAANARLPAAPGEAVVRFNSRIDLARSQLLLAPVRDGAGGTADERALELLPNTPDTELRAALPPLAPGRWRLRWQVLALDGHITRGDIPFAVVVGATDSRLRAAPSGDRDLAAADSRLRAAPSGDRDLAAADSRLRAAPSGDRARA